ncbi:HEAT repeat domain-containing protein [Oscillospiraceae bacterium PP1C4]
MNIETMVFVCIYICVCIVAFDLLFVFKSHESQWIMPKRIATIRNLIHIQLLALRVTQDIDYPTQRKLSRLLLKESYILAFMEVITQLREENSQEINRYLYKSTSLFLHLSYQYQHKPSENKAYFAYAISVLQLGKGHTEDHIALAANLHCISKNLMSFIVNDSVFVRENAFNAILSLGKHKKVLEALKIIDQTPAHQNEKLICDDMLNFAGDSVDLSDSLWREFYSFHTTIQVAILNYFRLLPLYIVNQQAYYAPLLQTLKSPKADKEVKLAILRYFRKHHYQEAYEELLSLLFHDSSHMWELAAVAATTLQAYPSETTTKALLHKMRSQNWYVRFNSAESLLHLGIDYEAYIMKSEDKYAREMLIYRSEIYKLKGKIKVMA